MSAKSPHADNEIHKLNNDAIHQQAGKLFWIQATLGFCAVATILLPAHPSLQTVFGEYELPAELIAIIFFAPVICGIFTSRISVDGNFSVIYLLFFYVAWMLFRSLTSPALGDENNIASLKSILILVPISVMCALVGAKYSLYSARLIGVIGLIAFFHYCALHFMGEQFGDEASFRSLSSVSGYENYQATSFYVGIVGVLMGSFAAISNGRSVLYGIAGLFLMLLIMSTIGARSAIVALIVSITTIFMFAGISKAMRMLLVIGSFVLVGISIGSLYGYFNLEVVQRYLTVIDRFTVLAEGGDPSHRLRLFTSAIQMWFYSASNFLVGGGVGAYPLFIGETGGGWYPHNFILESFAEGGLVAGFLLICILFKLVKKLRVTMLERYSFENVFLGALAVYALVSYQFMGGVQTLWIPVFFITLFLFSPARQEK